MSNPSSRQIEARTTGEQKETVEFLNSHHLIALIVFIAIIVSAQLWAETFITLASVLFRVKREEMSLIQWIITAFVFTIIAYLLVVYVFKVPLTSAFSF